MTGSSDEEDDYMNMVIAEPAEIIKESSIQRAARKKKEVGTSYVSRNTIGAGANRSLGRSARSCEVKARTRRR